MIQLAVAVALAKSSLFNVDSKQAEQSARGVGVWMIWLINE